MIERVGGRKAIPVDTRIVCATHQNLETMITEGQFREDLFYRLAEIVIKIPTLAERMGDPALLARHFMVRFAREMNPAVKGFSADALAAIDSWKWPGNVRELENFMERAVLLAADGEEIGVEHLPLILQDLAARHVSRPSPCKSDEAESRKRQIAAELLDLGADLDMQEALLVSLALQRAGGNVTAAAKLLNMTRRQLAYRMQKLDPALARLGINGD